MAHELSHYLLATIQGTPPCGWEEHEPLTDLTAIHEGFGIFMCNSAFQFEQMQDSHSQGWSSRSLGYLTESELAFCLGIYILKNDIDASKVASFLKPNTREYLGFAIDALLNETTLSSKLRV